MRRRSLLATLDDDDDDDDSASVDDVGRPGSLSNAQLSDVRAVIVACCVLSMVGCAFILFHYWRSARRRRQAALGSSNPCAATASIVPKMIVVLSVIDFCFSLPKVFGIPSGVATTEGASAHNKALCQTQGFVLQLAGLACAFHAARVCAGKRDEC